MNAAAPVARLSESVGEVRCVAGTTSGLEPDDLSTSLHLICRELAGAGAKAGEYVVQFRKLGSRILLSVEAGELHQETWLDGFEDVPLAAPRLAAALAKDESFAATRNADNVTSAEVKRPRVRTTQETATLGVFGVSDVALGSAVSGGFFLDLAFRMRKLSLFGDMRAGGVGSADTKLGLFSIDVGARYHLTDGDIAPYVGAGVGVAYLHRREIASPTGPDSREGSGASTHLELGVLAGRTAATGVMVALRADAPLFRLHRGWREADSEYSLPLSLNFGLQWR